MTKSEETKTVECKLVLLFDPDSGVVFATPDFPEPEKHGYTCMDKKKITFHYTEEDKLKNVKETLDKKEAELRAKFQTELNKLDELRAKYLQLEHIIDMGDVK